MVKASVIHGSHVAVGLKSPTGAGVVLASGKNVKSVEVGDPVLLSFYSCSECAQCEASHPAYCDSFAPKNYIGQQGSMHMDTDSELPWSQFFGQSSFAQYSTVHKSTIVNAKALIRDPSELKLFAPLGCGFQTGMGAVQNIAQAGPNDVVMVSGLGAVGMGAIMVSGCPLGEARLGLMIDHRLPRSQNAKQSSRSIEFRADLSWPRKLERHIQSTLATPDFLRWTMQSGALLLRGLRSRLKPLAWHLSLSRVFSQLMREEK